jgi:hypothetical protein
VGSYFRGRVTTVHSEFTLNLRINRNAVIFFCYFENDLFQSRYKMLAWTRYVILSVPSSASGVAR